jgi:AraC-like DNA-binding protein
MFFFVVGGSWKASKDLNPFGMVNIEIFPPHPLLADIIQNIFVIDAAFDGQEGNLVGHYPPTPQQCIFLYLNAGIQAKRIDEPEFVKRPRVVVVGPQVTRMQLKVNQSHKVAVIGFLPGGLYRLLGVPMQEIFDVGIDGHDLFGGDIYDLVDQCAELNSMAAIKTAIEEYLLSRLGKMKDFLPIDRAFHLLLRSRGRLGMREAADLACLSLRQFERKSLERLGMSPKLYARIVRFSNAYRLFEKSQNPDWAEIALQSGYFDQMHFIRDFKEFSGITPTRMEEELKRAPFRFQEPMRI